MQALGWFGVVMFFVGAWLLGGRCTSTRRQGIFLIIVTNVCFMIQGYAAYNWSLFALSLGAGLLQLRAWTNWRKYDTTNTSDH